LTGGIHGNTYNRAHTGSEKTVGQIYTNTGYKDEISLFAKANYKWKHISFFTDLQYRYANFDYRGSVFLKKMKWNFFNPKVGMSYAVKDNSTIYYSLGRTGREPTRNDIFGGEDDLLSDEAGNAAVSIITPEYVVDNELGFRHHTENLTFNVNLFYMDFKNEIVLDGKFGPNGLALTDKVEQSIRAGAEISIEYRLNNNFVLINNSSYNFSRIKEQSQIFTPILTPPLIINQEIVYRYGIFSAALSVKYQDKSYIDFANTSIIKDYFLVNSRLEYQYDKFQISVFLNNITGAKYFNNGYVDFDGSTKYFVQSPVNFYLSVNYRL
jgi:iron complex outermembrane receptor protein